MPYCLLLDQHHIIYPGTVEIQVGRHVVGRWQEPYQSSSHCSDVNILYNFRVTFLYDLILRFSKVGLADDWVIGVINDAFTIPMIRTSNKLQVTSVTRMLHRSFAIV